MSSGKKKLDSQDWASPADEQETFGSQSPYAAPSAPYFATPYNNNNQPLEPTAPAKPSIPFAIPVDAPPMYTKDPVSNPSVPQASRHPQELPPSPVPHPPQQPYQHQLPPPQPQYQPPPHPPQNNVTYLPPQGPPPPLQQQPQGDQYQQQPLLAPQQPQPQQYHPSAINYGATSNPNNGYYPAPRGPPNDRRDSDDERRIRRRYKKKKKGSCCSCCCLTILFLVLLCWYFKPTITIGGSTCFIDDDSELRKSNQMFPASQDLALKFEVLDGITGNILVRESESYTDTSVRIHTLMRASSLELLNQLEQSFDLNSKASARAWVHIKDSNDKEAKKRLTRENCARADVEIIYPRARPGTGKLQLSATNGQFNVKMSNQTTINSSSAGTLPIFEELHMGLMNGEVNLDGVIVSNKLLVEVTNGHILGNINSAGKVVAQIINGPVDLGIDSTPRRDDWDANNLHVSINTVNGRIELGLLRRFLGHFSMSTTFGNPTIRHSNPTTDNIKFTTRSARQTMGWISENSEEPQTPSQLDLGTVNGNILVEVDLLKK